MKQTNLLKQLAAQWEAATERVAEEQARAIPPDQEELTHAAGLSVKVHVQAGSHGQTFCAAGCYFFTLADC